MENFIFCAMLENAFARKYSCPQAKLSGDSCNHNPGRGKLQCESQKSDFAAHDLTIFENAVKNVPSKTCARQ